METKAKTQKSKQMMMYMSIEQYCICLIPQYKIRHMKHSIKPPKKSQARANLRIASTTSQIKMMYIALLSLSALGEGGNTGWQSKHIFLFIIMGKTKKSKEVAKAPPPPVDDDFEPIRTPPLRKQKTKTPPKSRSNSKSDLRKSIKQLNEKAAFSPQSHTSPMDFGFSGPAYPLVEDSSSYVF